MKKISYDNKNRWLFILIPLLILLIAGNLFKNESRNVFYSFSGPIQKFLREFSGISRSNQEIEEIRSENLRLLEEVAELGELRRENETLRQALALGLDKDFTLSMAEVSGGFSKDVLLLDKGEKDGVKKAMPVISQDKVLYGFVGEVYRNYSTVLLLSHPESSVNVRITNGDIDGEVRGEGGSAVLDLIPQDADLKEGELIVTRSFAGKYPERLLVGFVGEVRASDVSPFKTAKVKLFSASIPEKLFIITDF